MAPEQYTIFLWVSFVAALLTTWLGLFAWRYRTARGAPTFALLMLAVAVWTFSIGAGMLGKTPSQVYAWAVLRMAGVFSVPVLWLAFAMHFTGREAWLTPRRMVLLAVFPFLSLLLMVTNTAHHLFLKDILYKQVGPYLIDVTWVLGPWFWAHLAYSYALILIADFFILQESILLSHKYRRQAFALLFGATFPLIVNILFTFHLIPGLEVNYDPFGFVLAGVAFSFGFLRYRLFDLKPVARQLLLDSMSDGMLVFDEQDRLVDLNPAALSILKVPPQEAVGAHAREILQTNYDTAGLLRNEGRDRIEIMLEQDDENRVFELRVSPIKQRGRLIGHLIVLRDVTLHKQLENQLREIAIVDSLTGLYTRRHFFEHGMQEFERARRYQHELSLIIFDLDHFKRINDRYGHLVGDQVLRKIAGRCREGLRSMDLFARYGGEEFVILLPETGLFRARQIAERLRKTIESAPFETTSGEVPVTASLGISSSTENEAVSFDSLLDQADKALYLAKAQGRNRVTAWEQVVFQLQISIPHLTGNKKGGP